MNISKILLGTLVLFSLTSARATIITVSDVSGITPTYTESFEGFNIDQTVGTFYQSETIFGTSSLLTGQGATSSWAVLGTWMGEVYTPTSYPSFVIPQDGTQFAQTFGAKGRTTYFDINFSFEATAFGGYFADNFVDIDTTFDFFDATETLVDHFEMNIQSQNGELLWRGFQSDDASTNFSRVRISGGTTMDALVSDDGSVDNPVPEPSIIALIGAGLFGLGIIRRRRYNYS
ncbi:MAG: PEP-CTERM sorting domain-containing protein [Gammaproteobacteria bacterium]|nr:PEP-CTERM sorting domain-containing protein [Gammaproteobacteria bacterium]